MTSAIRLKTITTVDVTINGQTTTHMDSGLVLNTGGIDVGGLEMAGCPVNGSTNESTQWTIIGTGPCKGSLLSLAPASQTRGVGTTVPIF